MNRIWIAALMTVMICASGCGPSEQERFEANEKLMSVWSADINSSRADYIRLLISEGADVNHKNNAGTTPLMGAAMFSNNPELFTLLIEAGADIDAKNNDGETALMIAKEPEIIKLLKDAGAKGPTKEEAVRATEKLLLFDEHFTRMYGSSANYIRMLISEGADVNANGKDGMTPLMYARNPEVVSVLIEAGADVNAKDNDGKTPLMYVFRSRLSAAEIATPMLLIEAGADVNAKDWAGMTPIMIAAVGDNYYPPDHPELLAVLIEAGADVNARNKKQLSPLLMATKPEIIKLLKAAGAKE